MMKTGDEIPRRLCDLQSLVTAVLYYRWLATGLHDIRSPSPDGLLTIYNITGGRGSQSLRGNSSPDEKRKLLVVGGRLQFAQIPEDAKHQIK